MVGTVFLFIYWPSFNAALAVGLQQQRAIVNTELSLTASCLVAAFVSRSVLGTIDMEVLINATLAGGVVMGAACDLISNPGFAMIAGALAGAISALGFLKLNKVCKEKLMLHDTCGVLFLHGIPGTLGGFVSVICAAVALYNFNTPLQVL
jgi:ammonium transporter Rh